MEATQNWEIRTGKGVAILLVLLALEFKLYYVVALPGTLAYPGNTLPVSGFSVVVYLFALTRMDRVRMREFVFTGVTQWIVFAHAIIWFWSAATYPDESPVGFAVEVIPFLTLLAYPALADHARRDFEGFVRVVASCTLACTVALVLQTATYNFTGIAVLKVYGLTYGRIEASRSMGVRIVSSGTIDYVGYMSLAGLFFRPLKRLRPFLATTLAFCLIYAIYVAQTRSVLLIYGATAVAVALAADEGHFFLKASIVAGGVVVGIYALTKMDDIFASVGASATEDYSMSHRLEAVEFYLQRMMDSPLFGNGLLRDEPATTWNYRLVHGPGPYKFSYSDVGLVGELGRYGLMAITLYFPYFRGCARNVVVGVRKNQIAIAAIACSAASLLNLSLLNANRLLAFVLLMSFVDGSTAAIEAETAKAEA